jgi:hypothetical protein
MKNGFGEEDWREEWFDECLVVFSSMVFEVTLRDVFWAVRKWKRAPNQKKLSETHKELS